VLTSGEYTYCLYLQDDHPFLSILNNGILERTTKMPINRGCYLVNFTEKNGILYIIFVKKNNSIGYIMLNPNDFPPKINRDEYEVFELDKIDCEKIEDLRIAVTSDRNINRHNIYVTFTAWKSGDQVNQHFIGKCGDEIEKKIFVGRGKHGDITVDDEHIYLVWQKKVKDGYIIALQKKVNEIKGNWGAIQEVAGSAENGLVQRPRCSLASGILHVIFHVGHDKDGRRIYYKNSADNFKKSIRLTDKPAGYSSIDICAISENNIFVSMLKNKELICNLVNNGSWSGPEVLLKSQPKEQSCFLSDRVVSVVYNDRYESIKLFQDGDFEYKQPIMESKIPEYMDSEIEPEVETPDTSAKPTPESRKIDNEKLKNVKVEKHTKKNKLINFVKKCIKNIGSFFSGLGRWIFKK
jgi:hypothetical protein